MLDVNCVDVDSSLDLAASRLTKSRQDFSVVRSQNEVVGVLRLKDLKTFSASHVLGNMKVKDHMLSPARSIDASCSLSDALEIVIGEGIVVLIVVNKEKILGLLCYDDILKLFALMVDNAHISLNQMLTFIDDPNALASLVNVLSKLDERNPEVDFSNFKNN